MEQFICQHCRSQRKSRNSLLAHEVTCPSNPVRKYKNGMTGKTAWNKGLTKETNESVAASANKLKGRPGRPKTLEEKQHLSKIAKKNGLGGYRPHPNKGIRYKDIWFDSSWEVAVAKSLDEHNIKWVRPKSGFVWNDNNNKYYPDFYLPDYDVYLDPKNPYLMKKDQEKISEASKRNNIKVILLNENQLSWTNIAPLV